MGLQSRQRNGGVVRGLRRHGKLELDDVRWSVPPSQNWFTFTPTEGVLHLVTVRAANTHGTGPYAAEISVSVPRLSPVADRTDPTGAAVAQNMVVADPDGSGVSFTAAQLPPGVSIDSVTGRLSGTPTTAGTYRPTVTVADALGSDTQSFAWTITTTGGSGSPMTRIDLTFSRATPQVLGVTVVLSAIGQGGSTPMYRFWAQPWGGAWQVVQDWSASSTYSWRPTGAGGYNLTADGRGRTSGAADVTTSSSFEMVASGGGGTSPMTSVALSYTPSTPRPVGTAVVLTAVGSGGSGTPSYRFWVQPWGGAWQMVQDWSQTATYTWRPSVAGGYNLTVYGRTGSTGNGVSDSKTFEVTASGGGGTAGGSPMTGVALSFTPSTPRPVGTAVVLTAAGSGGSGTPTYRFWVQPWGGAWQIVQDWSTSATVTWRPSAAGGYNLTVYGRTGSTGNGDVSASRTFEATR